MSGGGGGSGDSFAEEPEPHENHERYLLTYADMITLLMALFIILFAIGQTDIAKFKRFQTGLQKEFGAPALDGGVGLLDGSQLREVGAAHAVAVSPGLANPSEIESDASPSTTIPPEQRVEVTFSNADQTAQTIATVLEHAGLTTEQLQIDVDSRGLVISLAADEVVFAPGSWSLQPAGVRSLELISHALARVVNNVLVEGHTDNRPMNPPMSNWELSALRASSVVRYFENSAGIHAGRLSLAGYGDTRPVADNATPAGRAHNRRVEIVIVIGDHPYEAPPQVIETIGHPIEIPPVTFETAKPHK